MRRLLPSLHWLFPLVLMMTLMAGFGLLPFQARTPITALAQADTSDVNATWTPPVNLSRSGAASQPRLIASHDGRLQALWIDRFDGLIFSIFDGNDWSDPVQALRPAAQFSLTPSKINVMPVMIIDGIDMIHGFWYGDKDPRTNEQPLLYSQIPFGEQIWKLGTPVAESALVFSVTPTDAREMQLAYIRTLKTALSPPGVFIRRAFHGPMTAGLVNWQNPKMITTSIYYRVITAEKGVIQFAALKSAAFLLWREPRLDQVLYSASTDSGTTWSEPEPIGQPGNRIDGPLLAVLPSGELLRIWQNASESGCALYQQSLKISPIETDPRTPTPPPALFGPGATPTPNVTLGEWSEASRIFTDLETCPISNRFVTQDDKLYWIWGEDSSTIQITLWDANSRTWSIPYSISFGFEDPETGWPVQLDHLYAAFTGDKIAVIGSDPNSGEVWATRSLLSALELTFAPPSPWRSPKTPANPKQNASQPATAADARGVVHTVWSQGSGTPGTSLFYAQFKEGSISGETEIIKSAAGEITRQPELIADEGGRLHLVWSGGAQGEIYYTRTNVDQASSPSSWLPAKRVSGAAVASWPQIAKDNAGRLFILYAQPLNEDRGIYLVHSDDGGDTWSAPSLVFDAADAGWEMVDHPSLAVGPGGELHAAWTKPKLAASGLTEGIYYTRTRGIFIPSRASESPAVETPVAAPRKVKADPQWLRPLEVAESGADWPKLNAIGDQLHLLFEMGDLINHRWLLISQQTPEGIGWNAPTRLPGWSEASGGDWGLPGTVKQAEAPSFGFAADAKTLHVLAAMPGRSSLRYSSWSLSGDGSTGRWSPVEYFNPTIRIQNLPQVAAGAPLTGGTLAVSWLAIQHETGLSTPAPILPWLFIAARQIPAVEPPAAAPHPLSPSPSPTLLIESSPASTATPLLDQRPSPGRAGLSPLVLGSGFAAIIVIAIFIGILVKGKGR